MNGPELLRKLRRLGAEVTPSRGKGGHVMVELRDRTTIVPMHGGKREIGPGLLAKILRDLGLTASDLR